MLSPFPMSRFALIKQYEIGNRFNSNSDDLNTHTYTAVHVQRPGDGFSPFSSRCNLWRLARSRESTLRSVNMKLEFLCFQSENMIFQEYSWSYTEFIITWS